MEEKEICMTSSRAEANMVRNIQPDDEADSNFPLPNLNPELFVVNSRLAPPPRVSEDGKAPSSLLGEETYPEGGLQAWLVVFGAWCGLFAAMGLLNTIATFQTYIAIHQLADYSEGTIGWIFSLYTFLAFFCGIYIGPAFDAFGPRWLVLAGSICVVAAVMLISVCTEYWHFILAFGLLNGLGNSLVFTPCIAAVGHFFLKRRGLATGIASTGGSVGGIVFPLMLQKFFLTPGLGWAWATRILGFVCLCFTVIANLLIRKRLPPAQNASAHPDFRIFGNKAFLLTTVAVFLMEFALFIPLAYISSYSLSQGFSEAFSFQILPILNASSVFGRALPGWWADRIGPFNANMASVLLSIIACFVVWLPFGHTVPGVIIFVIMFGFASGNNISITPVCVGRLCHTQQYGRYYATCYTIVSVACLVGIPIAGSIVGACGGEYWGLIVFTGVIYVLSLVAMLAAKVVSVGWKQVLTIF